MQNARSASLHRNKPDTFNHSAIWIQTIYSSYFTFITIRQTFLLIRLRSGVLLETWKVLCPIKLLINLNLSACTVYDLVVKWLTNPNLVSGFQNKKKIRIKFQLQRLLEDNTKFEINLVPILHIPSWFKCVVDWLYFTYFWSYVHNVYKYG